MSGINVDIGAKDAGFSSTISKVNQSVKGMGSNVQKVSASVHSSFASMAKAGAALAVGFGAIKLAANAISGTMGAFKDALDMGGELNDMSARTGIAIDQLSILGRAFENSGMSADKVGTSVNKLQKTITELGDGATEPMEAFRKLGLSFKDIKDKTPSEQLSLIGQRIMALETPAQKTAVAMKIFGKSGGEMLALFAGGKDSIAEAAAQLGSLPSVMAKVAATFDTTSDNLAAMGNKLKEFAAGVLSEMAPALELITTLLSRIDAAKIGQDFAQMLTGGTAAMVGFSDALAAIKLGEFSLAFGIAFESVKLQAAQSANSIYANLKAGISASVEFFKVAMGPGSGLWTMLKESFAIIASEISIVFGESLYRMVSGMSMVSMETKRAIYNNVKDLQAGVEESKGKISTSMEQIGGDLSLAATEAKKAFDATLKSTEKLIDTTKTELGLQQSKVGLLKIQQDEALKGLKAQEAQNSIDIRVGGERVNNAQKIKELEAEIVDAKAQGNNELAAQLTAQKASLEQLERSLASGKTMQEAMAAAGQAYSTSMASSVTSLQKGTKELKEQLTISQQLVKNINEAQGKDKIDSGGRLEKRANDQLGKGQFGAALRTAGKIERREKESLIDTSFGGEKKAFGGNIQDIAKSQGISTFRKTSKQLRDELSERADKRNAELNPRNQGKPGDGKDNGGKPADNPLDAIKTAVEAIKSLVAKIEPKLPTTALGV